MDISAFRDFYEFDDDDLYANRMGRLSDKQLKERATVAAEGRGLARLGAIVALVIAASLPALLLPISLITIVVGDWSHTFVIWAGCLVWLAVFGGAGLWLLRLARRPPAAAPTVQSVAGPVSLRSEQRASGGEHSRVYTVYLIQVGDTEFELDDELVGHIRAGEEIIAYYVGAEIISVEPVASPAAVH